MNQHVTMPVLRLLSLVGVMALLGAGCALPWNVDHAERFSSAWQRAMLAQSFQVDGTLLWPGSNDGSAVGEATTSLTFSGGFFEESSSSRLSLVVAGDAVIGTVPVAAEGEIRFLDETVFFRVPKFSFDSDVNDEFLYALGMLHGSWADRWVAITPASIAMLGQRAVDEKELSPENFSGRAESARAIAATSPFAEFVSYQGRERVRGVGAYRYVAQTIPDRVGQFLEAVTPVDEARRPTTSASRFDVWVSRRGGELLRVRTFSASEEGADTIPAEFEIYFSDWNTPFEVIAPTNSLSFDNVLASFATYFSGEGSLLRSLDINGERAVLDESETEEAFKVPTGVSEMNDTDGDGLNDQEEAFYGSDPNNPDTDGDGHADGAEVDSGYSPTGPGRLFSFGLP
jgi:hypothetical protein